MFSSFMIFCIFVSLNLTSRYLAIDYLGWEGTQLSGLVWASDLLVGLVGGSLIMLTHKLNRVVALLMLLLWPALHFANLESIIALNKPINLMDLHYATDGDFLANSLSSLSFPGIYAFFILLFPLMALARRPLVTIHAGYLLGLFTFSTVGSYVLAMEADNWQEANPMALSVVHYMNTNHANDNFQQTRTAAHTDAGFRNELQPKTAGVKRAAKQNVLLVVLEGIPGAYVSNIQDYFGIPRHNLMPNLSKIANASQTTPSFLTHSQQTIRGLYSMLCGDYSKQSVTTPKSLEYLQLDATQRGSCLPEILAKSGYVTSYLQAADLAFMGKDRFMPAIGFAEVNGKGHSPEQYVDFAWGPDDRAFFEQASTKIEQLRGGQQPWFLTLLTVGTHHPYAVPDEMVQRYANRKEAAVAYMDDAIGAFMTRLKAMGVPRDTLIIFTSDESHGVPGHPYGNNWGLNLIMGPDITPGIHSGMYGLSDLSLSILDYLDMGEQGQHFIGRSLFALYEQPRRMLFHSVMAFSSEKEGEVLACNNSGNCYRIYSSNNKLFSSDYQKTKLPDSEGANVFSQLQASAYKADTTLYEQTKNTGKGWTLLSNVKFSLNSGDMKLVSGGSFINVPPASRLTITLRLNASFNISDSGVFLSLGHNGFVGQEKYKTPIKVEKISLPRLKPKEGLELVYHFYSEYGITHFSPVLQARADGTLNVERFHIAVEPYAETLPFGVERFTVIADSGERTSAVNIAGDYRIPTKYNIGQRVDFKAGGAGTGMLTKGWSNSEIWGTWSKDSNATMAFYVDSSELSTSGYSLELASRIFVSATHPTQDFETFFNGRSLGKRRVTHPDIKQTLNFPLPPNAIKEGLNQLSFDIDAPSSPKSLGLGNDSRRLGIGLHSLKIVKNP